MVHSSREAVGAYLGYIKQSVERVVVLDGEEEVVSADACW
jgi:hypothetical protein